MASRPSLTNHCSSVRYPVCGLQQPYFGAHGESQLHHTLRGREPRDSPECSANPNQFKRSILSMGQFWNAHRCDSDSGN
jgi:hypothetical protein